MKKFLYILVGITLVVGVVAGVWWWNNKDTAVMNPWLGKKISEERGNFRVVGFVPTWMVGKTKVYGGEVSDLVFLGVEADGGGNLVWDTQSQKINSPDYLKLKAGVKNSGGRNVLGVKLFKDSVIEELVASPEARMRLVEQIKVAVESGGFDGVNMDFEYMKDPLAIAEDKFGILLDELRLAEVGEISLDVFANTVIKSGYERLAKMMDRVDYIVVMGYDFHTASSDFVGPVAPLGAVPGERSIGEVLDKVKSSGIDKSKVVVALPLYGYQWKTVDDTFESQSKDYVAMITYNKMKEFMADPAFLAKITQNWDELSATPWISFKKDETVYYTERVRTGKKYKNVTKSRVVSVNHQVYYENAESLIKKLETVKKSGMGGTGFWALGYEDTAGEVWGVLEKVLKD